MMPSPFMILYFAIFCCRLPLYREVSGDINSLNSCVAVVFGGAVVQCGLLLLFCKVEVIGH